MWEFLKCCCLVIFLLSHQSQGLEMKQQVYYVTASPSDRVSLACQADVFPTKCIFKRPDGQELCTSQSDLFSGFGFGSDDYEEQDNCIEDPNAKTIDAMDECKIELTKVNAGDHFGDWTCTLFGNDNTQVSAKISVAQAQPALVEFDPYFGKVEIDVGSHEEFPLTCLAKPENEDLPFERPPGEMRFVLDGYNELDDVKEWEKNGEGFWSRTAIYRPDVYHSGKSIKCILRQGQEEVESSLTLTVTQFQFLQDSVQEKVLRDGQENVEIDVKFKAYPQIPSNKVKWIIGGTTIKPEEQEKGNYEAYSIQDGGSEFTYVAKMTMKQVSHSQTPSEITFQLELPNGDVKNHVIKLAISAPTTTPSAPLTQPPVTERELQEETTTAKAAAITQTGASLYIVIAIIVIVVLVCALFYITKCRKRKDPQPQPAPAPKDADPESGPLLPKQDSEATTASVKDEDETKKNEPKATSDPKEDTGKNDDLEQASKELEKKLEPNDDEDANKANSSKGTSRANSQNDNDDTKVPSGKSSPLPQDKAENETDDETDGKTSPKKRDDDHQAIEDVLDQIKAFVQDEPSVIPKETEQQQQAVPITPPSPRKDPPNLDDSFNPSNKSTPKQPEDQPKPDLVSDQSSPKSPTKAPKLKPSTRANTEYYECNSDDPDEDQTLAKEDDKKEEATSKLARTGSMNQGTQTPAFKVNPDAFTFDTTDPENKTQN